MIDVTVMGTVKRRQALTRGGARPGDDLYVSGTIGVGRGRGSRSLQSRRRRPVCRSVVSAVGQACTRYLCPEPRVAARRAPGAQPRGVGVHGSQRRPRRRRAADGGGQRRRRRRSTPTRCRSMPRRAHASRRADATPVIEALTAGDDYELLIAVRPRTQRRLTAAHAARRRHAHAHRPLHAPSAASPSALRARRRRRGRAAARVQPLSPVDSRVVQRRRATMIHLTKALIRRWLDTLLHVADTPERTAAAFAMGVFFGFSPFLGLHTLLAIIVRVPVRPESRRGAARRVLEPAVDHRAVLRDRDDGRRDDHRAQAPPGLQDRSSRSCSSCRMFHGEFWHRLITILKPLLWPYTVGSHHRRARASPRLRVSARARIRDKSAPDP